MPGITVGEQDWQQVAVDYAQQNMELRAHLAAARRTVVEMEQANAVPSSEAIGEAAVQDREQVDRENGRQQHQPSSSEEQRAGKAGV